MHAQQRGCGVFHAAAPQFPLLETPFFARPAQHGALRRHSLSRLCRRQRLRSTGYPAVFLPAASPPRPRPLKPMRGVRHTLSLLAPPANCAPACA